VSWTRRWHKTASAVLLIASGMHLAQHWAAFVADDPTANPTRRAAIDAMQAHIVYPPLGTTLWTVLGAFSLGYAIALATFGTSQWILAREADPRALRRHALRNVVLLGLGALAMLALHPQPQLVFVLAATALLFALAAWPRSDDE
jgi:hypothetical protein